jgi:hypothetical protein
MRALALALMLALPAQATEPPRIATQWSAAIAGDRINDWMALHAPDATMHDLGTDYRTPDRIRGWGVWHAHRVQGIFTPTATLHDDGACVIWTADYVDLLMTARFVIAMTLADGRITHTRIDRDRPDAPARTLCPT